LDVYTNRLKVNLINDLGPIVKDAGIPKSTLSTIITAFQVGAIDSLQNVPGINPEVLASLSAAWLKASFASYKVAYLTGLAAGGISIIAAWFAPNTDQHLTGFVNKTIRTSALEKLDKEIGEKEA
jgi:hypothetical protein